MNVPDVTRVVARVTGRVQGVGFRWSMQREFARLGLAGRAVNLPDGSVEVVAEGEARACRQLIDTLSVGDGIPGRVDQVTEVWDDPRGERGFRLG